jgi:hypothetical protein
MRLPPLMPTTPERLTDLEASRRELERRLSALEDGLDGGPSVPWARSVRGRLHAMQSAMASAEMLRKAAEASAHAQRDALATVQAAKGRRLSRWTQVGLLACGAVTAAAPYVLHFAG